MGGKTKGKTPDIIFRNGKPAAVVLDIAEYQELLERLEDLEDLKALQSMREKSLKFRKLDDFLEECDPVA
jgi:PHD/YefM family antitoxin component YafN of YafNO toxin-antitoxin module